MIPVPLERLYQRSRRLRREAADLIRQAEAVERAIGIAERQQDKQQEGRAKHEAAVEEHWARMKAHQLQEVNSGRGPQHTLAVLSYDGSGLQEDIPCTCVIGRDHHI